MNDHDPFSADASVGAAESDKKAAKTEVKAEERPEPAPTGVPAGTSREIMDWVGNDKTKANAALQTENSSGTPRKGLVADLQEMLKK